MAETYKFTIVTPDGEFYNKQVEQVTITTTEGDMGILYDHTPTTVALSTGPIIIKKDGETLKGVIHGGFAEIKEDQVILLPDAAEWPEAIDLERARAAKERALKILESRHLEDIDAEMIAQAEASHARAITRLDVAEWYDKN
jgi:F-type H+-transporting ATPase subunit epsilon